jgi:hypothetical protein
MSSPQKSKMAAMVRFLPSEQTLNYFWMQIIEYRPKEYLRPLKFGSKFSLRKINNFSEK